MSAESIIGLKKLVHPEYRVSDKSVRTDIDYVGPYSTLYATLTSEELVRGSLWGDYVGFVTDISIRSIEGTSPVMGELTVSVEYNLSADGGDFGFENGLVSGTVYEIDWAVVDRGLIEHPEFQDGGVYALTEEDRQLLARWEQDKQESMYGEMSPAAFKYAEGIDLGIRTWEDYAPVLTKTTSYTGGPPPSSEAGGRDVGGPSGFPNKPTGYEWRKSADRSLRSGSRDKWDRTEQWMGAKKVLVDKDSLFY